MKNKPIRYIISGGSLLILSVMMGYGAFMMNSMIFVVLILFGLICLGSWQEIIYPEPA